MVQDSRAVELRLDQSLSISTWVADILDYESCDSFRFIVRYHFLGATLQRRFKDLQIPNHPLTLQIVKRPERANSLSREPSSTLLHLQPGLLLRSALRSFERENIPCCWSRKRRSM